MQRYCLKQPLSSFWRSINVKEHTIYSQKVLANPKGYKNNGISRYLYRYHTIYICMKKLLIYFSPLLVCLSMPNGRIWHRHKISLDVKAVFSRFLN